MDWILWLLQFETLWGLNWVRIANLSRRGVEQERPGVPDVVMSGEFSTHEEPTSKCDCNHEHK